MNEYELLRKIHEAGNQIDVLNYRARQFNESASEAMEQARSCYRAGEKFLAKIWLARVSKNRSNAEFLERTAEGMLVRLDQFRLALDFQGISSVEFLTQTQTQIVNLASEVKASAQKLNSLTEVIAEPLSQSQVAGLGNGDTKASAALYEQLQAEIRAGGHKKKTASDNEYKQ